MLTQKFVFARRAALQDNISSAMLAIEDSTKSDAAAATGNISLTKDTPKSDATAATGNMLAVASNNTDSGVVQGSLAVVPFQGVTALVPSILKLVRITPDASQGPMYGSDERVLDPALVQHLVLRKSSRYSVPAALQPYVEQKKKQWRFYAFRVQRT